MFEGVFGGVVTNGIGALARWALKNRSWAGGRLDRWSTHFKAKRRERAKARVIKGAEAEGRIIPIRLEGGVPTKVVLSDGSANFYFPHAYLESLKRGVSEGRYPPDRTFLGKPPRLPF